MQSTTTTANKSTLPQYKETGALVFMIHVVGTSMHSQEKTSKNAALCFLWTVENILCAGNHTGSSWLN